MSALDEFLGFCDADPDFDSGESDTDDPFARISKRTEDSNAADVIAERKSKEFELLFGSPVQVGLNTKDDSPTSSNKPSRTPFTKTVTNPRSGIINLNPKTDDSLLIIDPFSRLRLFKNSVQIYYDEVQTLELSIKERNLTVPYTPLEKVPQIKDKTQFWTCGVLVKKAPGVRQSAKGNEYGIWEISDLDGPEAMTVFLFGGAATAEGLKTIPIGALIDLTNPSVMPDKQKGSAAAAAKLSVSLASQIRHIGTARDFGFCGSRRKDGKDCMNPVNKFKCDVCIHHASAELRKLSAGKKSNSWAKKSFTDLEKVQYAARMESLRAGKAERVTTVDFGKPGRKSLPITLPSKPALFKVQRGRDFSEDSFKSKALSKPGSTGSGLETPKATQMPKPVRMELQDSANSLRRSSLSSRESNISFSRETCSLSLPDNLRNEARPKKEVNLNPAYTKHMSDRDRFFVEKMVKSEPNSELPAMLTSPNPGSQNFLKFLSDAEKNAQIVKGTPSMATPQAPGPLVMNREALMNMQKALAFVKKSGPISKGDPNKKASLKRKLSSDLEPTVQSATLPNSSATTPKSSKTGSLDTNSEEFQRILNAKSAHANIAEENQEADYFTKLERKEAIENKLMSTFSLSTTAFMCRECKYVALSQSDLCKEKGHAIRAVKATKRFFKCKDCGNRTMSLDRLPKQPCSHCKSSSWLVAPVGKEKSGPTLDSESLSIRGDEEKFLGSSSAKLFL